MAGKYPQLHTVQVWRDPGTGDTIRTVGIGRAITLALEDMRFTFVGVRPAVRQSCLWRHSFNWRNRKRGHPAHREGKA